MIKIVVETLKIAIPYSVVASLIAQMFTMRNMSIAADGTQTVTRGLSAIAGLIGEGGIWYYFLIVAPQLSIIFLAVFFALLIQGVLFQRKKRNA
jgi:hypothetical protein